MSNAAWADIDAALLAAHDRDDKEALIGMYAQASEMAAAEGDIDRAAFFATHAWIFALEAGDPRADRLGWTLAEWDRMHGWTQ